MRINPKPGPEVWMLSGRVALIEARLRMSQGQSPLAPIEVARVCFGKAAAADGKLGQPHRLAGEAATLEARWRTQSGLDPLPALVRARGAFEKAVAVSPKDARGFAGWAERCRWAAEWRRARGQSADAEITEGLERARQALALMPTLADAMAAQGALQRVQAESIVNPSQRRAAAQRARDSLRRALELNAHLRRAWEPELKKASEPRTDGASVLLGEERSRRARPLALKRPLPSTARAWISSRVLQVLEEARPPSAPPGRGRGCRGRSPG